MLYRYRAGIPWRDLPERFDDFWVVYLRHDDRWRNCRQPLLRWVRAAWDAAQLSPADASLHAYLQHAAGSARHLFEAALERLVVHEGLIQAT